MPEGLRTIGEEAFIECELLRRVVLSEGLEALGDGAFYGSGLESVRIPSTLRRVEERAFMECRDLRTVKLAEGLTEVGRCAFFGSGLEGVAIPQSVRFIGAEAFSECRRLRTLTIAPGSRLASVGRGAFGGTALEPGGVQFPPSVRVHCRVFDTD